MSEKQSPYKDTLLLPQTAFPMRANLTGNEPLRLESWERDDLYHRIQEKRRSENAPPFILHDGPPFANGDVHMGTALNKILKDFVVKSRSMAGFRAPFIPGWDCHGLPIEFKVAQQARDLEPVEIRQRCTDFAAKFIDVQRASFRRLGVLGDWEKPYLTMDPAYEANVIRVFAKLVAHGCVYQSEKPVQWSYGAHTALAEAEVEYREKTSPAIFVAFAIERGAPAALGEHAAQAAIPIWTTTPWTLPANLGLAVHPEIVYQLTRFQHPDTDTTQLLILARDLVAKFTESTGWTPRETLAECPGADLASTHTRHPFINRTSPVITARFVTTEDGTGIVHIAPGHGADDYVAGREHNLGLLSPVDDDGRFTEECGLPDLVGTHVFDANPKIIDLLRENGTLLGHQEYTHSYPHCWRSKTPVIFRAVEQFFISLDTLRNQALEAIAHTTWLPAWGKNRIHDTVEARPDWCISRQRTWGVPLPVFFTPDGAPILDESLVLKVADLIEKEGSNIWFASSDAELATRLGLPEGTRKGRDTLDVWIDSGCSHAAVLDSHPDLHAPCDLYLEATDQHRGWFQSSLMLSIAQRGGPPYKTVMTHGFVVDQDRRKLSKSEAEKAGKPIDAAHFYNKYGADIVRLWASSIDWQREVPFGEDLFKQVTEPYRRLRNTLRILLGNLHDFTPDSDHVLHNNRLTPDSLPPLDKWMLSRLHQVTRECRAAYDSYDFRRVFTTLNQFCATDLSAIYIDATKDCLYCDAADSSRRRAAQTVIHDAFSTLTRLLAPILAFTADEAWEHAPFTSGCVHEQDFPEPDLAFAKPATLNLFRRLFKVRDAVQTAIESQIQEKSFSRNNEAAVEVTLPQPDEDLAAILNDRAFATEFFIIAEMRTTTGNSLAATATKTTLPLCPRCRAFHPLLESGLCLRCDEAIAAQATGKSPA